MKKRNSWFWRGSYLSDFIPPVSTLEICGFSSVVPERWFAPTFSEGVVSEALGARARGPFGLRSPPALLARSRGSLRGAAGGIAARHGWFPAHSEPAVRLGFERVAALALLALPLGARLFRQLDHRAAALGGRRRVRAGARALGLGQEKALEANGVGEEKQSPEAQRDQTGEEKQKGEFVRQAQAHG